MISYILQVTICWLVFYLAYRLLFARLSFFQVNRFVLLGLLLLGLILPGIELPMVLQPSAVEGPTVVFSQNLNYDIVHVNTVVNDTVQSISVDWNAIILIIYLLGVLIMSVRLLKGVLHIARLYWGGEKIVDRGYTTVFTRHNHRPFSFFYCLFLSRSDALALDSDMINIHEKKHMDQLHSLDILFVEILQVIFWCSPLIHLYRKELRRVHEFSADAAVLLRHRLKDYRAFLLQELQPGLNLSLGNPFFSSQIKHRIRMMKRTPSYRINYLRYFSLLPVALLLSSLFGHAELVSVIGGDDQTEGSNHHVTLIERNPDGEVNYWLEVYGEIPWGHTEESRPYEADSVVVKAGWKKISNSQEVDQIGDPDVAKYFIIQNLRDEEPDVIRFHQEEGIKLVEVGAQGFHIISKLISVHTRFIDPEIYSKECPHFPGCEELDCAADCKPMLHFIYKEIRYPSESRMQGRTGEVAVQFVVSSSGEVENVMVVTSVDQFLDAEVKRVVETLPDWTPRYEGSEAISTTVLLRVLFRLDDGNGEAVPLTPDEWISGDINVNLVLPRIVVTGYPR